MRLAKVLTGVGAALVAVTAIEEIMERKQVVERTTLWLLKRQPQIEMDLLNDYLDKKVVSVQIAEDKLTGVKQPITFNDVVLHRSSLVDCEINSASVVPIGNDCVIENCTLINHPPDLPFRPEMTI